MFATTASTWPLISCYDTHYSTGMDVKKFEVEDARSLACG